MTTLLLLLACQQDYELYGDKANAGSYNPPDPPVKEQVDAITQVTIPAVDVLWVIDNSCSMAEEQTALRDNFDDFMKYFTDSGLDYHVGVVSTDMDNRNERGKLILDNGSDRYIDSSYDRADAVASFRQRAALGTNGSSDERGKDAAYTALTTEKDRTNVGFYRDDASLSIITISDEIDYSQVTTTEFVNFLTGLKAGTDNVVTYSSIVGLTNNDCSTAERGTGYLEVTRQVGGIEWSICTSDWAGLLEELGLQAAGLKREFYLSLAPVEDSIKVKVKGDDTYDPGSDTWTYDPARNSVKFDAYIPAPLSVVEVTYLPLATAAEDAGEEVTE
ncbi:MAG TPA: hypothetical protein PKY30_19730 [Myxococcota bacterium]|nr:hypothetical protein [Myxococcota bacterium]